MSCNSKLLRAFEFHELYIKLYIIESFQIFGTFHMISEKKSPEKSIYENLFLEDLDSLLTKQTCNSYGKVAAVFLMV